MVWLSMDRTDGIEQLGKVNAERIPVKPFSVGFEVNIRVLSSFSYILFALD
jgi:hypothetical protein